MICFGQMLCLALCRLSLFCAATGVVLVQPVKLKKLNLVGQHKDLAILRFD